MEPAEEIVTSWLKQNGYLAMNEVKVGYSNKEIDILAVNPRKRKKLHVEVHVSIRPLGGFRAWSPARFAGEALPTRIKYFCQNKFVGALDKETRKLKNRCVEEKVREIFGSKKYGKMLVVGQLHKSDPEARFRKELKRHGVELVLMKDVLNEISEKMKEKKEIYMDSALRYLQIQSSFMGNKIE